MDGPAIITQVANPKEDEGRARGASEKASHCNVSLKKQRNRSILSSFFCCFRDYNVEAPPASSPSVLPPLVEENGGLPKGDQRQVIPIPSPPAKYLLPEVTVLDYGKKCVVIDLDETLVHSSFKEPGTLQHPPDLFFPIVNTLVQPISNADFIVPVEIDGVAGVRAEAAARGRVPPEDGPALRVRAVHCQPGQVRRPRGRPAGPLGGVPGPALQRILRFPPRELREGPEPPGTGAEQSDHRGQFSGLVHLPP
ncbi:CTD small phosphatase-like protein isoform X6 [Pipistrellus kuhlii]|uniref:CTD small phosphatase-like protein isoform X6 n=1 Tax=Pipistrellus kuhlii TaxID=59472 RepID=UPI00174F7BA6|nr:CTD small phosphatase-like protein isoform X6 [Pipistrellus kuhlii]